MAATVTSQSSLVQRIFSGMFGVISSFFKAMNVKVVCINVLKANIGG